MDNLAPIPSTKFIRQYDLKGSTVNRQVLKLDESGRKVSQKKLSETSNDNNLVDIDKKKYSMTLKDMDFRNLEKDGVRFIGETVGKKASALMEEAIRQRWRLVDGIKADSDFLCKCGTMDYSLLLTKVDLRLLTDRELSLLEKRGNLIRVDDEVGFLVGLLDVFETWRFKKMFEKFWNVVMSCNLHLDKSSQPPDIYS